MVVKKIPDFYLDLVTNKPNFFLTPTQITLGTVVILRSGLLLSLKTATLSLLWFKGCRHKEAPYHLPCLLTMVVKAIS